MPAIKEIISDEGDLFKDNKMLYKIVYPRLMNVN